MQNKGSRLYIAVMFALMASAPAFAQDVIGITPISTVAITAMKLIAVVAIGWGFMRLLSGRHTVEGLVMMAVGCLGVGKTEVIASLFNLGG